MKRVVVRQEVRKGRDSSGEMSFLSNLATDISIHAAGFDSFVIAIPI
jgi:hypothetical protein